jgi:outer membrane receptor protein involved in Fe transport
VQYNFPSAVIGSPTNSPQWWKEMNVQFNNSLSYFVPNWHGEHSLRAGFQYFRPKFWGELPQESYGAFSFARDPADFNDPATYPPPTSFSINLGDFAYSAANPTYAAFVQDNWSITPRLSLNLGVRYDVESGVKNTDFANPVEAGDRSSDADNIAPRVGFAYDVRGTGRTVVRGGYGRYYDKVLLNITTNERRQVTGQFIAVTVQNPSLTDPLGGLTFDDYKNQNRPRNITVLGNDYATPRSDQVSIGMAQQIGARYAVQADFVHTKGVNEPRQREVNQFEDPDTHLPRNPATFGRPFPQYIRITRYETSAKSKYDGLQLGFTGRSTTGRVGYQYQGSYILSKTYDDHTGNRFSAVSNPFNLADEYAYASTDQRHRFIANVLVNLPYDFNVSAIYFAGSKRPINVTTNNDPFGIASSSTGNGRWLNAAGDVVPRNSERTLKNDYKLDLRLSKTVRLSRVRLEGMVDAFNVLNTGNISSYGNVVGAAAYLTPNQSAAAFYQPRQIQFGFRVSY